MLVLYEVLALLFTALAIGIIGNLVGIGGGVLLMVVLLFGFNIPPIMASGLSLLTILVSAGIGTISNAKQKALSRMLFVLVAVFAGIGAILGSILSYHIGTRTFDALFGLVSIGIGLFSIFVTHNDAKKLAGIEKSFASLTESEKAYAKGNIKGKSSIGLASVIAGLIAGIFGIGIGGIVGTYLTAIKKMQPKIAFSTVLAAMIVTSILGSLLHLASIRFTISFLVIILSLAVGAGIGAIAGSHISSRLKSSKLRFAQGYIILSIGIIALLFSFFY